MGRAVALTGRADLGEGVAGARSTWLVTPVSVFSTSSAL